MQGVRRRQCIFSVYNSTKHLYFISCSLPVLNLNSKSQPCNATKTKLDSTSVIQNHVRDHKSVISVLGVIAAEPIPNSYTISTTRVLPALQHHNVFHICAPLACSSTMYTVLSPSFHHPYSTPNYPHNSKLPFANVRMRLHASRPRHRSQNTPTQYNGRILHTSHPLHWQVRLAQQHRARIRCDGGFCQGPQEHNRQRWGGIRCLSVPFHFSQYKP